MVCRPPALRVHLLLCRAGDSGIPVQPLRAPPIIASGSGRSRRAKPGLRCDGVTHPRWSLSPVKSARPCDSSGWGQCGPEPGGRLSRGWHPGCGGRGHSPCTAPPRCVLTPPRRGPSPLPDSPVFLPLRAGVLPLVRNCPQAVLTFVARTWRGAGQVRAAVPLWRRAARTAGCGPPSRARGSGCAAVAPPRAGGPPGCSASMRLGRWRGARVRCGQRTSVPRGTWRLPRGYSLSGSPSPGH